MNSKILERLNTAAIQQKLSTNRIGRRIVLLESADSTNDIAWSYADKADADGICVVAEYQTAGRGRRGRTWFSQPAASILCSVLIQSPLSPSLLTLATPIAIAETIAKVCGIHSVIKWPNDILLDTGKVAGILIESRKIKNNLVSVIGIGINVHQEKHFFENLALESPATSLDIAAQNITDRNQLMQVLLEYLETWIDKAGLTPEILAPEWQKYNRQIGARIELDSDGRIYSGTCVGIDPMEGLLVHLDHGPIRIFSAAHSSIVKK